MSSVYKGVWTPNAKVQCFHCHGLKIRERDLSPFVLHPLPSEGVTFAPGSVCRCDTCERRIHITGREDVTALANLRDLINGRTSDGRARMEQTGGMCAGVNVTLDTDAFLSITDAEEPGDNLYGLGLYIDHDWQEDFSFTDALTAETAAETAAEWVNAWAKWPKITNIEQGKAHFAKLQAEGNLYHPDDPAEQIINLGASSELSASGRHMTRSDRVFTDAEAAVLNHRMDELRALDWSEWGGEVVAEYKATHTDHNVAMQGCPCGYLIETYPVDFGFSTAHGK